MGIPKQIFMFWNSGEVPVLVQACVNRVRALHPGWKVELIRTVDDACGDMPCVRTLSVQHQSDWVRCCVIAQKGGVWLDATCICQSPVTSWVDMSSDAVQGFGVPFDDRTVLENWAFAAPAKSRFMLEWLEELRTACFVGHEAYCSSIPDSLISRDLRGWLPYLTMHAAFVVVRTRLPNEALRIRPSDDPGQPYSFLVLEAKWDSDAYAKALAKKKTASSAKAPLLKLRSIDREAVARLTTVEAGSVLQRLYREV